VIVATAEGWLYLAVILDLFSRRVVGWKLGESLSAELVGSALQNALALRQPPRGSLLSFRPGVEAVCQPLQVIGAVQSMSGTGNCSDNANAEAFFSSLKTECFPLNNCFGSKVQARREIFEYIEIYYNNQRLHSALGFQTPNQCEAAWTKAKETTFSPEKVPVTSSAEGAVEVKRVNGINRRGPRCKRGKQSVYAGLRT